MSDDQEKPYSTEVKLDAVQAMAHFAHLVAELSGKTTDFEIENLLPVPLDRWSYIGGFHPSSGSHGSGQFPDHSPVDTIDPNEVGLTAYESAGAGAIAAVVYRVRGSDVYVICYAGNPDVGSSTAGVRILYNPDWDGLSASKAQGAANLMTWVLNGQTSNTDGVVKGMGLEVSYDFTGSRDYIAEFSIKARADAVESFALKSVHYHALVGGVEIGPISGPISPTPAYGYAVLGTDAVLSLNTPCPAAFENGKQGRKPVYHVIKLSGQDGGLYMNHRDWGGRLKVYDDESSSSWSIYRVGGGVPADRLYVHCLDNNQWLRAAGDDCYADVDDDHKADHHCQWEKVRAVWNP